MMVTATGWDDIGSVLSTLGFEWMHYSESDFVGNNRPDVLFINCGSETGRMDLADFIFKGGVVYISDHAKPDFESIMSSIGETCNIQLEADSGTYRGIVTDQNLAAFLGTSELSVEFDTDGWAVVHTPPRKASVLMEVDGRPVVMSVKHGLGCAIFTSFHNSVQTSDIEKQLIRYLALKPLLKSKSIRTVKQTTKNGGKVKIVDETEPVVGPQSGFSKSYTLPSSSKSFQAELNWLGASELKISVCDDAEMRSMSGKMSPLRVSLKNPPKGTVHVSIETAVGVNEMLVTSLVCSITEDDSGDRESLRTLLG